MPRVTVTKADVSTKGKPRVYFDNLHNWQNAIYIGQNCGTPPSVGMVIDADTSSTRFPNAKADTWFLNRYSVVQGPITAGAASGPAQRIETPAGVAWGSNLQAGSTPAPGGAQGDATGSSTGALTFASAPTIKGWSDLPTGDMLRWVSNVVGSAIAAQLIRTPSDIAQWVGASYRAAESLRSGDVPEFDSDVPRFIEPDPVAEQQQGEDEFEGDESIPF